MKLPLFLYRLLAGKASPYVQEVERIKREQEAEHNRENVEAIVAEFDRECALAYREREGWTA